MEPSFSHDWLSHHLPLWEKHLRPYAGRADFHILEVGSFEGRSACWFLQNILTHPSATLTCVDTFTGSVELHIVAPEVLPTLEKTFDGNIAAAGATQKVRKCKGPSQHVLRMLPLHFYDVIYIDGSHMATDVLTDIVMSWPLLRNDGILILDDYTWTFFQDPLWTPRPAIDAFLGVFHGHYDLLERGAQIIVRKRTEQLP